LEHGGWVVFEDVFLVIACLQTKKEMWEQASQTAQENLTTKRLNSLVAVISEVVWRTDAHGNQLQAPRWSEIGGQTIEQSTGLSWLNALHPDDPESGDLAEILKMYIETMSSSLSRLKRAIDLKDAEEISFLAHNAAGMSANLGITVVVEPLRELERKGREKSLENTAELSEQVVNDFFRVKAFLQENITSLAI